jgi:hypothetical protein
MLPTHSTQNRLLQMIRTQQLQLEQMRQYQQDHTARHQSPLASTTSGGPASASSTTNTAVVDDLTPTSERSFSIPNLLPFPSTQQALPRTNRRNSRPRAGSSATSPTLRPVPIHTHPETSQGGHGSAEWPVSPIDLARRNSSRDEGAYYQAETATLTRENQMLRLRVRELERQVDELHASPTTPAMGSNLIFSATTECEGADGLQSHASRAGSAQVDKE